MEPFAIHCTTCRARLTVSDPSLRGQILACPKCGSMVLVEATAAANGPPVERGDSPPPTAQTIVRPRGAAPRDSAGLSDTLTDTFEDLDGVLAGHHEAVSPGPPTAVPSAATRTDSAGIVEPPREEPAPSRPVDARHPDARSAVPAVGMPPVANSDEGLDLEGPRSTPAAPRWSPMVIVATAGVLGVVLAITVSVGLIAWMGRRTEVAQSPDTERGEGSRGNEQSPQPSPSSNVDAGKPPESPPKNTSESTPQSGGDQPASSGSAKGKNDKPSDPRPSVEVRPSPADDTPSAKPGAPSISDSAGTDGRDPPIDLVPKPADKGAGRGRVGGVFADLLNGGIPAGPTPEGAAPEEPPAAKPREPRTPEDERPVLPRPLAREVDVAARLQDRLGEATYREVALADFAQEISDLSTIPITLDLDRLRYRKIFASTRVSARVEQATIEQLLQAALEPHKLSWTTTSDAQLVIGWANAESSKSRLALPVDDLLPSEELTTLVSEFAAPEVWSGGEEGVSLALEKDQLVVEAPEFAQLEVAAFLERLRWARKLKPKAPTLLDEAYGGPDAVGRRGAAALAKTLRLNYARPTRLTTILQRLGKDSGIRLVPNWESLATLGWTLETQATVTVDGKSLAETLSILLEPMDLTYRVVDDETIEVLAPAAANAKLQVEFHSAEGIADEPERLVRRVESELGESQFRSAGGRGLVRYDRASDCIIASLPDAAQRVLSQRLSSWRMPAKDASGDAATPDR